MANAKVDSKRVMLKGVRLSFPSLFKKAVFEGNETKFEASFIMDRETQGDMIDKLEKAVEAYAVAVFGKGQVPKSLKRTCLIDGDTKDYDGYENAVVFKGGSTKRIAIIDRDKTPLTEADGLMTEGGDYVNALVAFWYSDHPKGGKQILGNIVAIQYDRKGESFAAGGISSEEIDDVFDNVEDEDEEY